MPCKCSPSIRYVVLLSTVMLTLVACGCGSKQFEHSISPRACEKIAAAKTVAIASQINMSPMGIMGVGGMWTNQNPAVLTDLITLELLERGYQPVSVDDASMLGSPMNAPRSTGKLETAAEKRATLLFEFSAEYETKTSMKMSTIPIPLFSTMKTSTRVYTKVRSLTLKVSEVETRGVILLLILEYKDSSVRPRAAVRDIFEEFDRLMG